MTLGQILPDFRYRDEVLKKLKTATEQELQELERARQDRPVRAIAWSARNLLELWIWVQYCQASEKKAKRFSDDAVRDTLDLTKIDLTKIKGLSTLSIDSLAKTDKMCRSIVRVLKEAGFEDVEDKYTTVFIAAESLKLKKYHSD